MKTIVDKFDWTSVCPGDIVISPGWCGYMLETYLKYDNIDDSRMKLLILKQAPYLVLAKCRGYPGKQNTLESYAYTTFVALTRHGILLIPTFAPDVTCEETATNPNHD